MGAISQDWLAMVNGGEDIDFTLDRLLAEWFQYRRGYRLSKGYSGSDGTCRDHRAPGHWDWWNGAADAKAEEMQVKQVDEAIDRIKNEPRRWRTAIEFEAMNLHSGRAVWTSPMLPRNFEERQVLVLEARNMLLLELRRDGIMG